MSGKIFFKFGSMNSGKSLLLLAAVHNYESQGKEVILLKPSLDTRSKTGRIESRIGLSHECIDISQDDDLFTVINELIYEKETPPAAILLDEAQFLKKEQVKQLVESTLIHKIPILCYGLKNSFVESELFEGSAALLYYADKIEEIKTVCKCGHKANFNLRILNGIPIYSGEIINCGDTVATTDFYIPCCKEHYYNPSIFLK